MQCTALKAPQICGPASSSCTLRISHGCSPHVTRKEVVQTAQVRLGTLEQAHAENEWTLRAYTRSAKKFKLSEEAGD